MCFFSLLLLLLLLWNSIVIRRLICFIPFDRTFFLPNQLYNLKQLAINFNQKIYSFGRLVLRAIKLSATEAMSVNFNDNLDGGSFCHRFNSIVLRFRSLAFDVQQQCSFIMWMDLNLINRSPNVNFCKQNKDSKWWNRSKKEREKTPHKFRQRNSIDKLAKQWNTCDEGAYEVFRAHYLCADDVSRGKIKTINFSWAKCEIQYELKNLLFTTLKRNIV